METAKTILKQLGNKKFIAMTGAKSLSAIENGLSFKLPARFAKNGINYVKIKLNSLDLYDVEYGTVKKFDYVVKSLSTGLYFDMLQADFTSQTGLNTHL